MTLLKKLHKRDHKLLITLKAYFSMKPAKKIFRDFSCFIKNKPLVACVDNNYKFYLSCWSKVTLLLVLGGMPLRSGNGLIGRESSIWYEKMARKLEFRLKDRKPDLVHTVLQCCLLTTCHCCHIVPPQFLNSIIGL